jgi:SAM-dependent methyltransferase
MDAKTSEQDREQTLRNRAALLRRPNLLFWYEQLYRQVLGPPQVVAGLRVLEMGSGTSPLKRFYPSVLTSDVMPLEHVDLTLDAHEIDRAATIAPGSLDIITLTNVLHHLRAPVDFLLKAHAALRPGGRIIAVEPYYSSLSRFVWTRFHHEPSDFAVREPRLAAVEGPLASANMAIPFLIFFGDRGWEAPLRQHYLVDEARFAYHSALSYLATGGISRSLPVPPPLYRLLWTVDDRLARRWPHRLAAFFSVTLVKA